MLATGPAVSVVVPVYNGAPSLPELVERLFAVFDAAPFRLAEIVLVDDASADNSWGVIERLAADQPLVRGLALARNFGQHAALLAGIAECTGDVIVTMDDDLQHLPEEIPALLVGLTPDSDLVYGRAVEEEHTAFRNLTSRGAKWAVSAASGSEVARNVSGFRAFRAWLIPGLLAQHGPYVSLDVLLSWLTQRIGAVPVVMDQRRYGSSNYDVRRLIRHALTMLFGFSTVPLRVASYVGLALGLIGGLLFVFVIIQYLLSSSEVPGFAFLASAITAFSGAQLLALGVIGEYVARLYAGSTGRPAYVTRDVTPSRQAPPPGP